MQEKQRGEYQFDFTGGQLALDLANTVSRRDHPERRREHLESFADLISFARQANVLSSKQANELRRYALRHEAEARRAYRKAITLREALYRVFAAIAQHKGPRDSDFRLINNCAIEALRNRELQPVNGGYAWQWRWDGSTALERILWPAAQAAAALLTSDDLKMVRFCEAPDCEWLFLDRSRNRSRRWCDMTTCGNREKARRHYQRTHE